MVTPDAATIFTGGTTQLTATVRDAANNVLSGRAVSWTSSNLSVASVSSSGLVTGASAGGPVSITASSEGQSGSALVTVLAPVASVTVTPDQSAVVVGGTVALTASLRDASNNVVTGRPISWTTSHAGLASVSGSGVVTALAPGGPVLITATSEGKSGTAEVMVLAPVVSVTLTGAARTKVGDQYPYTATARLADGTVVVRPVTWGVADPSRGIMSSTGILTPLQEGLIIIRATIDGTAWEGQTTAYDWFAFGGGTTFGVALDADLLVTNKFGTSEYPQLALGCSGGLFLIFVDTENFVTANGFVTYGFDDQPLENGNWVEFDLFSALGHPGPDAVTRAFGSRLGLASRFWFAFTEFNASARATMFRVTGLASRLPAFTTCPLPSSPMGAVAAGAAESPRADLLRAVGRGNAMTAERELRAALRASTEGFPDLVKPVPGLLDVQRAIRGPEPRR